MGSAGQAWASWARPKSPGGQRMGTNRLKDVQMMLLEGEKRLESPKLLYCRVSPIRQRWVGRGLAGRGPKVPKGKGSLLMDSKMFK